MGISANLVRHRAIRPPTRPKGYIAVAPALVAAVTSARLRHGESMAMAVAVLCNRGGRNAAAPGIDRSLMPHSCALP
jgi:hypothetical protein